MAQNEDCGICGLLPGIADQVKQVIAQITGQDLDFCLVIFEPEKTNDPHFISNENPALMVEGIKDVLENINNNKYQQENAK